MAAGPVAGAGQLGLHHRRRQPDGVRDDRPGRHAGLRPDRDLRRARRPSDAGRGPVRRARRRAADRHALPLQAGGDDRRTRSSPSTAPTSSSPRSGQYAVLATTKKRRRHAHRRDRPGQVSTAERRPDPGASATRRRWSTRTRWRRAKGDVAKIDTREPAERHARRRLRRRGRQEAGRAAVRDAAAVRSRACAGRSPTSSCR